MKWIYTPGPWEFVEHTQGLVVHTKSRGTAICEVTTSSNAEANAKAIAACPEMIDALEAIQNLLKFKTPLTPAVIEWALTVVNTALVKARGES